METAKEAKRQKRNEAIFWDEIDAVTIQTWSEEEIAESDEKAEVVRSIMVREMSPAVIGEAMDCLTRDWCCLDSKIRTAFLDVLQRCGALESMRYNPNAVSTSTTKRRTINGIVYEVGI